MPTMYDGIPYVTLASLKAKANGINYDGNDPMSNAGWTKFRGATVIVEIDAGKLAYAVATGGNATDPWMILDGITANQTPE